MRFKSYILVLLGILPTAGIPFHAQGQTPSKEEIAYEIDVAFARGEGATACALVERYALNIDKGKDTKQWRVSCAFFRGDYANTLNLLTRRSSRSQEEFYRIVESSERITKNFERRRFGKFIISHPPGVDEVLVPYLNEALELAELIGSQELGIEMRGPVLVEIYPNPEALAEVSGLTVDEIRRSETVAIAKWGKLMLTSPAAFPEGYAWYDTVIHEYMHLLLSKATQDRMATWLQEGIAKYIELKGRSPEAFLLPLQTTRLLLTAFDENKLIPFQRYGSSIAKFSERQSAALAFAQSMTFVDAYIRNHGIESLRRAFSRIETGASNYRSLAQAANTNWSRLETEWRAHLIKLRDHVADEDYDLDSLEALPSEAHQASQWIQIGDRLWNEGYLSAAFVEYEKARAIIPDEVDMSWRYARAALHTGKPLLAIEAAHKRLARDPHHGPSYRVLAQALEKAQRPIHALKAAQRAIHYMPFDPEPHCIIARIEKRPALDIESIACGILQKTKPAFARIP